MIVVTNTSPLLNLACIGHQSIVESLFEVVQAPPAMSSEIQRLSASNPRFTGVQIPAFARVKSLQNQFQFSERPSPRATVALAARLGSFPPPGAGFRRLVSPGCP